MNRSEQIKRLEHLRSVGNFMDTRFSIAGIPVGLDAIIGLIPGVGDVLGGLISLYIVFQAHRMQVPSQLTDKMLAGVVIDVLLGSIPVAGDIFDVFYKINERNIRLLEKHLEV